MGKNDRETQRKADSKRAGTRTRNWTVILYPEDLPEDWRERLDETHVRWVESPLHSKDLNADGKPKKPHHHILFMFDGVKNVGQVQDMLVQLFGMWEESIIGVALPQMVHDRGSLIRYFCHYDNPEKVQYNPNDIVGHNGVDVAELWRYSASESRNMVVAMEEYIEAHGITELCDFSAQIRNEHPEWHTVLSTQMTLYFTAFIRSRRHKLMGGNTGMKIDKETGEIIGT